MLPGVRVRTSPTAGGPAIASRPTRRPPARGRRPAASGAPQPPGSAAGQGSAPGTNPGRSSPSPHSSGPRPGGRGWPARRPRCPAAAARPGGPWRLRAPGIGQSPVEVLVLEQRRSSRPAPRPPARSRRSGSGRPPSCSPRDSRLAAASAPMVLPKGSTTSSKRRFGAGRREPPARLPAVRRVGSGLTCGILSGDGRAEG